MVITRRRWVKRAGRAVGLLALLVASLLILVQVDEWTVRRHTEKLIAEMYGLKVGETTLSDAQGLLARWHSALEGRAPSCAGEKCEYSFQIQTEAVRFLLWVCPNNFTCRDGELWLAGLLHAHLPSSGLDVEFEEGVLVRASVTVTTEVPKGAGPTSDVKDFVPYSSGEYTLIAQTNQKRVTDDRWGPPFSGHILVSKPSACTICIAIRGHYHSQATRAEVEPLLDFRLACMTRWKPCTVEADIAPQMWNVYSQEP